MQQSKTVIRRIWDRATNMQIGVYNAEEADAYVNSMYLSQGWTVHSYQIFPPEQLDGGAKGEVTMRVVWLLVKDVELPEKKK